MWTDHRAIAPAHRPARILVRTHQVTTSQYDGLNRRIFAGFGTTVSGGTTSFSSSITYAYDAGNQEASVLHRVKNGGTTLVISRTEIVMSEMFSTWTNNRGLTRSVSLLRAVRTVADMSCSAPGRWRS